MGIEFPFTPFPKRPSNPKTIYITSYTTEPPNQGRKSQMSDSAFVTTHLNSTELERTPTKTTTLDALDAIREKLRDHKYIDIERVDIYLADDITRLENPATFTVAVYESSSLGTSYAETARRLETLLGLPVLRVTQYQKGVVMYEFQID